MNKFLWILTFAVALTAGCKGDKNPAPMPVNTPQTTTEIVEPQPVASTNVRREDFPFDQLFGIFSLFGDNIMTDLFASGTVKDLLKDEIQSVYDGQREFDDGACNVLSYSVNNDGCYDGFQMGCWRYDADDHLLVVLLEEGGCDASGTKYIRAYDYDPATNSAHEVDLPLNRQPKAEDFDDIIRLAGCSDIPSIRQSMRDRIYNYAFSPEGLTVELNVLDNFDAQGYGGFDLFYRWNGSDFVRDESVPYPCIHDEGFAMIKLNEPMPGTNFDYDPLDYDIRYSEEGGLWLVDRDGERVLEIQMEGNDVGSVEVFDPRYSLQQGTYWRSKNRLCVGSRINDFVDVTDEPVPEVRLYRDGTVDICFRRFNSIICLRTTSASLEGPLPKIRPTEAVAVVNNPAFKPTATVKSIIVSWLPHTDD